MSPLLRTPALRGDDLYFVSDDALWFVASAGGRAHRLTADARVQRPVVSHDGRTLAFTCAKEGVEDLYTMEAHGGPLQRRTWLGGRPVAHTFSKDDQHIVFSHGRRGPFLRPARLHRVGVLEGVPEPLGWGPGSGYSAGPRGAFVLAHHMDDLAHWKRYRGGRVGRLWVDDNGSGELVRLPSLGGNVACPMWIDVQDEARIVFVSDHEGPANLYSVRPNGKGLVQHTFHTGRAVRFPCHDGTHVVYERAGRLHRLDLASGDDQVLDIDVRGPSRDAHPRHIQASRHLEDAALHPGGHSLLLTVRGRPFVGGHWEGPLRQLGRREGVRYRLATFLSDTEALWVSDEGGEEHLEIADLETGDVHPIELDVPHERLRALVVGPNRKLALVDDRSRVGLLHLDGEDSDGLLRSGTLRWLTEGGDHEVPHGLRWSPDGAWLVFAEPVFRSRSRILLADLRDAENPVVHAITDGRFHDLSPDFDPSGRYLVFLSHREVDPVPDRLLFGYGFPRASRPYLVTLQADCPSPFDPPPRALGKAKPPSKPEAWTIEPEGIAHRIVPFPVPEARYSRVLALPSGRFLFQKEPVKGAIQAPWKRMGPPPARSQLVTWDPTTRETATVYTAMSRFRVDPQRKTLAVQVGARLRVFPADPDKGRRTTLRKNEPWKANRQTGWIDIGRARLFLDPRAEWRQMLVEAWRLQRDRYWDPGHAGVDWDAVLATYLPEVERVQTRAELGDLVLCMQGELATSHAYAMGGDHPSRVVRTVGRLAADFRWEGDSWLVERVHPGDPGDLRRSCPLLAPGVRCGPGTRILAVDGQRVPAGRTVESFLVGHASRPVELLVRRPGEERQTVWVRPLATDQPARYRTWVHTNRAQVHDATDGRIGYLHVPDMGPNGFADFHRDFLSESARDGLIVDVRYNRGGHVSQLLLGRLATRRLGFTQSRLYGRWPYPAYAQDGPLVALTNAYAGSDGDIFSQGWKSLQLGPLIGERTWGGVVGIRPSVRLVDGGLTTQPEFATYLDGPGYGLEGHGVDPDIEVVMTPMDWASSMDPQLERAIREANELLAARPLPEEPGPPPKR